MTLPDPPARDLLSRPLSPCAPSQVDLSAPTHPFAGGRGEGVPRPLSTEPRRLPPTVPRPTTDPVGPASIELLEDDTCWSRLGATHEGLLSYATGRGTVGLAVTYSLRDRDAVIPMIDFNEACHLVPGTEAVLEISGRVLAHDRWVVRLSGLGRLEAGATRPVVALRLATSRVRGYTATWLPTDAHGADHTDHHTDHHTVAA